MAEIAITIGISDLTRPTFSDVLREMDIGFLVSGDYGIRLEEAASITFTASTAPHAVSDILAPCKFGLEKTIPPLNGP